MIDYNLNKNQINFFNTFGFIIFKGLFLDKIKDIITIFEEVFEQKTENQNININQEYK